MVSIQQVQLHGRALSGVKSIICGRRSALMFIPARRNHMLQNPRCPSYIHIMKMACAISPRPLLLYKQLGVVISRNRNLRQHSSSSRSRCHSNRRTMQATEVANGLDQKGSVSAPCSCCQRPGGKVAAPSAQSKDTERSIEVPILSDPTEMLGSSYISQPGSLLAPVHFRS